MAWVQKYDMDFTDPLGNAVSIDIYEEGASAGILPKLDVAGGAEGFQIRQQVPDYEKPWGLMPSVCTLGLRGEHDFFDHILTQGRKDHVLTASRVVGGSTSTLWVGYIETEDLEIDMAHRGYNAIRSTCGLNSLETNPWYADLGSAQLDGRLLVTDVILEILDRTQPSGWATSSRINFVFDWTAQGTVPNATDDPLAYYTVDVGYLYERLLEDVVGGDETTEEIVSCWQALEALCQRFQLLIQRGEHLGSADRISWYVRQRKRLRTPNNPSRGTTQYDGWAGGPRSVISQDTGEDYAVLWDDTSLDCVAIGKNFKKRSGPNIETVEIRYDHDNVSGRTLPSFWTSTGTLRWTPVGVSLTTARVGIPNIQNPASTILGVEMLPLQNATETDITTIDADTARAYATEYIEAETTQVMYTSASNQIEVLGTALFRFNELSAAGRHWAIFSVYADDGASTKWLQEDGTWGASEYKFAIPQWQTAGPVPCRARTTAGLDWVSIGPTVDVGVRLYWGVDTLYAYAGNQNTVESFTWGPFELLWLPGGSQEGEHRVYRRSNDSYDNDGYIRETVFIGDGPWDQSEARIALDDANPANRGVLDDWEIERATYPGSATGETLDSIWAEDLMRQFGKAPRQYKVNLKSRANDGLFRPQMIVQKDEDLQGVRYLLPLQLIWYPLINEVSVYLEDIRSDTIGGLGETFIFQPPQWVPPLDVGNIDYNPTPGANPGDLFIIDGTVAPKVKAIYTHDFGAVGTTWAIGDTHPDSWSGNYPAEMMSTGNTDSDFDLHWFVTEGMLTEDGGHADFGIPNNEGEDLIQDPFTALFFHAGDPGRYWNSRSFVLGVYWAESNWDDHSIRLEFHKAYSTFDDDIWLKIDEPAGTLVNLRLSDKINPDEAFCLALTVDRTNETYLIRWVSGREGYGSYSGSFSATAFPTVPPYNNVVPQSSYSDHMIEFWGSYTSWAYRSAFTVICEGSLTEIEFASLYHSVRDVMIAGRGIDPAELPAIGISRIVEEGAFGAVITVGTEAGNVINVGVQLTDAYGNSLSNEVAVDIILSDDSPPTSITATAPSGGWAIGTDGSIIYEPVTSKVVRVLSEADGHLDLDITETGAATWYLTVHLANGSLVTSDPITFA